MIKQILTTWRVKRLRRNISNLEWYTKLLEQSVMAHRMLAEQKRVELSRLEPPPRARRAGAWVPINRPMARKM